MINHNKHALTNWRRLVRICDTSFWGDALLFVGFSSFILELWRLKRAQTFFSFFNWWREKPKKKEFTFFVPLVCTVCWLNISCTNCWFFKCFLGKKGDKEGGERREEALKREEFWWTYKLVYSSRILKQLVLECISTSPWLLICYLSLESLLLICAKCLMLWDHSEYHLLNTAQEINSSNFFPLKKNNFFFILVSSWSLSLPFLLNAQAQGWKMKHISNVKYHFLFL